MIYLQESLISQSSIHSLIDNFVLNTPPNRTKEDDLVWSKMITNITNSFEKYSKFIYPPFEDGFIKLNFDKNSIPDLEMLNRKLNEIGWNAIYVNGFVPASIYALMLSNQIFPVSASFRSLINFNYSPAPDFTHDVLGHLPMLFVKEFRDLLSKWATKTSKCSITFLDKEIYNLTAELIKEKEEKNPNFIKTKMLTKNLDDIYKQLNHNPSVLSVLSKYYGWSFEFGIIKVKEIPNIFGAAIISSFKEMQNVCEGRAILLEFNEDTLRTGVNYTRLQEKFFYIEEFARYNSFLDKI